MTDLTGKVAVVMGASGQLSFGSTIARLYAKHGAKVVVGARRLEPLQALAQEIDGTACACDISKEEQIENLTKTALDTYGKIDVQLVDGQPPYQTSSMIWSVTRGDKNALYYETLPVLSGFELIRKSLNG